MRNISITVLSIMVAASVAGQTLLRRIDIGPGFVVHESAADHIIVQTRAGADAGDVDRIFRGHGAARLLHHAGSGLTVLRVDPARRDAVIAGLKASGMFSFVEPDYLAKAEMVPNDPGYAQQWHLGTIQAPSAWNITTGSSTPIAMVDSGVDPTHPDLASKLVPGWNFVSGNSTILDTMGHGTTTAGAAAAIGDNAVGVTGVAWNNPIMPLIVLDPTGYASYSNIASAIMYAADHGARIVNVSIGGTSASSTLQNAVNYAWSKGTVVFASAGNGGTNAPYYPAGCQNAVAVGATDSTDTLAYFSNYGSFVGVTAPGVGIYTTAAGGGYTTMSGTSYSSPIAAGVAALVLAQAPSLTASGLVSLLENNSDDLGAPGYDPYYGYGRINAYRAVSAAAALNVPPPVTTISTPGNGSSVSGNVSVQGTVTAQAGLSQVQFLVDGSVLATGYSSPFAFSWNSSNAANGTHTISVRGYDASNHMSQASVAVNVNNLAAAPISDTTPPSVSFRSPVNGQLVSGNSVTVSVLASDNVKVAQVSVYLDGIQVYSGSAAPYSFNLNTKKLASGNHTLIAKAWDSAGNSATSSAVAITVR